MSTALAHPKYRSDIDGLRAVAVLSVLVFHAFPEALPGGYIGVDVFFVISGYLISTIIISSLEKNHFSLPEFYRRRIKRIFPGLILILIAVVGAGWVMLFSAEFQKLGIHVGGAAGFVSNFILQKESGYFDVSGEAKPLLHLWSLAIEEQFYLIWPIVLMAAHRLRLNVFLVTVILGSTSFFVNLYYSFANPSKAFYWPFGRFWELLIGAVAAVILLKRPHVAKKWRDYLSGVGALLLLIGFVFFNKKTLFPGFSALIPTLGAFSLVMAGSAAWVNSTILSRRVLVWTGLISYPLYLWHWPLISLTKINYGPIGDWATGLVLGASFLLAFVTFRVEQPIRFGKSCFPYTLMLLSVMFLLGILGLVIRSAGGFPDRDVNQVYEKYSGSIKRSDRLKECFDIDGAYKTGGKWFCELGQGHPSVFAFGDSHAFSLLPALEKIASDHGINILFAGSSGCPPLMGVQSLRGREQIERNNCFQLNERIARYIEEKKIPAVLLIARWSYYTGNLLDNGDWNPIAKGDVRSFPATVETSREDFEYAIDKTLAHYESRMVKAFIVKDNPQQSMDPVLAIRRSKGNAGGINAKSVTRKDHAIRQEMPNIVIDKIARRYKASPISFDSVLCEGENCPFLIEGKILYFDDDHLSVAGSYRVVPVLEKSLAFPWKLKND